LPHAHIIFWVTEDTTTTPATSFIDQFMSAEILDLNEDPLLYALVAEHMVHGSCGADNLKSPCMKNGKCSKGYPVTPAFLPYLNYGTNRSLEKNSFVKLRSLLNPYRPDS
jgi:hypothetical protein